MSNTAELAGFIVHDLDGGLIWGLGETEEAAWSDAHASSGCTLIEDELVSVPATGRLVERVKSWGGCARWKCVRIDGKVVADVR